MSYFPLRNAWGWMLGLLWLVSCSASDSADQRKTELDALAQAGDWQEIEHRIELYRAQGSSGSYLDYYEGWAQLSQDEDRPAREAFGRAVEADSNLAFEVASHYRAAARRDQEGGWLKRAAHRMLFAYRLDGNVEMGELGPEVADLLFNEKDYLAVIPVFRHLLRGEAEAMWRQRWTFRLGLALEQSGMQAAGLEQYRRYWEEWPRREASSTYQSYVLWRQGVVLLDFAEERMEHGDCPGAIARLDELLALGAHAEHRGLAFYRKGLCLEDLNRLDEARECYRRALEFPSGEGGGINEQARERLRALAENAGR